MPSGSNTASVRYWPNSMPDSCCHRLREHREAVVGVDPALARLGHHLAECIEYPEACASRWRTVEPGGPAGVSSSTHALLDRDLYGAGDQRLGHRRQREAVRGVAVLGQHTGRADHRRGGRRDRPVGDRVESCHRQQPIRRLHAATIAATWRASVPQHPPSTVTAGSRSRRRGVPGGELGRIALVEFGRLVEFGVALRRRVRAQSDEPLPPRSVVFQGVREMRRVRTVDHEVRCAAIGFGVDLLDRLAQRLARRQPAVGLHRERDRRRNARRRRRPARYRSPPRRWSS